MHQENYKKIQAGRYITFLKIALKVCLDSLFSYSHPKTYLQITFLSCGYKNSSLPS